MKWMILTIASMILVGFSVKCGIGPVNNGSGSTGNSAVIEAHYPDGMLKSRKTPDGYTLWHPSGEMNFRVSGWQGSSQLNWKSPRTMHLVGNLFDYEADFDGLRANNTLGGGNVSRSSMSRIDTDIIHDRDYRRAYENAWKEKQIIKWGTYTLYESWYSDGTPRFRYDITERTSCEWDRNGNVIYRLEGR